MNASADVWRPGPPVSPSGAAHAPAWPAPSEVPGRTIVAAEPAPGWAAATDGSAGAAAAGAAGAAGRGVAPGARRPTGSAQGLAPYVDDHGQDEKHRTEGNNRARPEPWLRLCELVHNRGAKCGPRADQRVRPRRFVADDQRDGDRLAQGPADSERHGCSDTGTSRRPHHFADDLPARGTKCHGGFPVGHRDGAQGSARKRHQRRQRHDRKDHRREQNAGAVVGPAKNRPPEHRHRVQEGFDVGPEQRGQDQQRPQADHDARDRGQQFDEGGCDCRHLGRDELGQRDRCSKADRCSHHDGNRGGHHGADYQEARPGTSYVRRVRTRPHEARPEVGKCLRRAGGDTDCDGDYDACENSRPQPAGRAVTAPAAPGLLAGEDGANVGRVVTNRGRWAARYKTRALSS